jgi:hypothetical protein
MVGCIMVCHTPAILIHWVIVLMLMCRFVHMFTLLHTVDVPLESPIHNVSHY